MSDRDEDGRIGAYAPPADDDLDMFDAREEEARRGPLLLAAAFAAIVLFFAVLWQTFQMGVRQANEPRILADAEPYRVAPADPGGVETPNTDIEAYDRLSGERDNPEDATPRDAPEEPLEDSRPPVRVETVDADAAASPPLRGDRRAEAGAEVETAAVTPRPRPQRPAETQAETQAETRAETAPAPDPAPRPVRQTAPAPSVSESGVAGVSATGEWLVQIASLRSAADADAAWTDFAARFSDIAGGLSPDVRRVEIEGRGDYHRVRIAAFATRDDAIAFCDRLKARGQDCLVARR